MTDIERAAAILRAGGLVAFPTETVYGLGANALDAAAVARIFVAKGRPATNPVIVHVADVEGARRVVAAWPALAQSLAERYWPGPLSLVLPKQADVPDVVTAGGPTVAVRVPAHPVALELLKLAGVPVAAPSANRSMELSPARAEHVPQGLADFVLDGGPCTAGIESTVLDVTGVPRLLRPGPIPRNELEAIVGPMELGSDAGIARSPGQMSRHYCPRTPLALADAIAVRTLPGRIVWVNHSGVAVSGIRTVLLPAVPHEYAARIYSTLHELDREGLDLIAIEPPPVGDAWQAVRDRLQRAATPPKTGN